MNDSSEAANRAAIKIRRVPFGMADMLVSLFDSDAAEEERAEQMILNRLAETIEQETHCGILLRVAEAAKKYAGATTDCCMGGEATGELCELHQALAQWDYLTKPKDTNEPR